MDENEGLDSLREISEFMNPPSTEVQVARTYAAAQNEVMKYAIASDKTMETFRTWVTFMGDDKTTSDEREIAINVLVTITTSVLEEAKVRHHRRR